MSSSAQHVKRGYPSKRVLIVGETDYCLMSLVPHAHGGARGGDGMDAYGGASVSTRDGRSPKYACINAWTRLKSVSFRTDKLLISSTTMQFFVDLYGPLGVRPRFFLSIFVPPFRDVARDVAREAGCSGRGRGQICAAF